MLYSSLVPKLSCKIQRLYFLFILCLYEDQIYYIMLATHKFHWHVINICTFANSNCMGLTVVTRFCLFSLYFDCKWRSGGNTNNSDSHLNDLRHLTLLLFVRGCNFSPHSVDVRVLQQAPVSQGLFGRTESALPGVLSPHIRPSFKVTP